MVPGLRDALRSLLGSEPAPDETWRLADSEVVAGLAAVGRSAEVALVREGVERGLPGESAWSPHDWMTRVEGGVRAGSGGGSRGAGAAGGAGQGLREGSRWRRS